MNRLCAAFAVALLAGHPVVAGAQVETYDDRESAYEDTESFDSLDDNDDGRLDEEEAEEGGIGDLDFEDADTDDSGFLSPDEYRSEVVDPVEPVAPID